MYGLVFFFFLLPYARAIKTSLSRLPSLLNQKGQERDDKSHKYDCVCRELKKSKITGGLRRDENDEIIAEMPEDKTERERESGRGRKSEEKALRDI